MNISRKDLPTVILIMAILAISVLITYYKAASFEFIYYDDPKYVRDNPVIRQGISIDGIKWAFSSIGYSSNWHPATWISHMIDAELFGINPGPHHMVNVLFHIINTLLLFFVFFRMTKDKYKCALIAALFAVHPLHVESVAWIAERKDVLSTLFFLLTLLSYAVYVEKPDIIGYMKILILYSIGLMAKPMLVTLPFVLLLLDLWPLRRNEILPDHAGSQRNGNSTALINFNGFFKLIYEKIPFFILALISSVITFQAQKLGGAVSSVDVLPVGTRILNVICAYATYLCKMFWPVNLAVFYPYSVSISALYIALSLVLLALVSLLAIRFIDRRPFFVVGWFWFLGTLVPVIGLVQVGFQSMADRYTYIPSIGISIMLVWGLGNFLDKTKSGKYIAAFVSIAVIAALMHTTWTQNSFWKDSKTLFSHALDVTKDNYLAHANLSATLFENGDIKGTVYHATQALRIRPDIAPAHCNLGLALNKQGMHSEAIDHFQEAIRLNPYHISARFNLGGIMYNQGRTGEAIKQFKDILRLNPHHKNAKKNLKLAMAKQIQTDSIMNQMLEALEKHPGDYTLHEKLAQLYNLKGEIKNTIYHYEKAVSIKPDLLRTINALVVIYAENGKFDKAISSLKAMATLKPDDPGIYYNIACMYSRQGNLDKALESLSLSIDKGFTDINLLKSDPDIENIRKTGYYKQLIMDHQKSDE